jgi:hypothetical protein
MPCNCLYGLGGITGKLPIEHIGIITSLTFPLCSLCLDGWLLNHLSASAASLVVYPRSTINYVDSSMNASENVFLLVAVLTHLYLLASSARYSGLLYYYCFY